MNAETFLSGLARASGIDPVLYVALSKRHRFIDLQGFTFFGHVNISGLSTT